MRTKTEVEGRIADIVQLFGYSDILSSIEYERLKVTKRALEWVLGEES